MFPLASRKDFLGKLRPPLFPMKSPPCWNLGKNQVRIGSFCAVIINDSNDTLFQVLYYILAVAFCVPLTIMTIAYIRTGVTLFRSVQEARALTGPQKGLEIYLNYMKISPEVFSVKSLGAYIFTEKRPRRTSTPYGGTKGIPLFCFERPELHSQVVLSHSFICLPLPHMEGIALICNIDLCCVIAIFNGTGDLFNR